MMTAEARVQQLDEALTLTADQKTKVTAIYAKAQEDMRAMMRDGGGDQQANREKMMESMRTTRDQVRALLTDEQKAKFDAMPQRGGRGEGRGREGAPGGGAGDGQQNRGKKKA
jgi:periplasmic protein CpxP/Spy